THVALAVVTSGLETLSIAFVNGLSQYFRTAIVGLVIRTVSVNAIAGITIDVIVLPIEIDAAGVATVPFSLTTLIGQDPLILSVPHSQPLLFKTGTFLSRFS